MDKFEIYLKISDNSENKCSSNSTLECPSEMESTFAKIFSKFVKDIFNTNYYNCFKNMKIKKLNVLTIFCYCFDFSNQI